MQNERNAWSNGPGKSKDFDTGNVLGPFILTADEGSPCCFKHGSKSEWGISGGNSKEMHHSFSDIIVLISDQRQFTLERLSVQTVGTGSGIESGKKLVQVMNLNLRLKKLGPF